MLTGSVISAITLATPLLNSLLLLQTILVELGAHRSDVTLLTAVMAHDVRIGTATWLPSERTT